MTKVSDFAESVDDLLSLTPGKTNDISAALSTKMPTTDSLGVTVPQNDDEIAIVREDQQGNKTYLRCNLADILSLSTGQGSVLSWKSPDGSQGNVSTLNIVQGLQGEEDSSDNTQLNLSVSDDILGQVEAPCFLSLASSMTYAGTHTDPQDTKIWFGHSVLPDSYFAKGDSATHTVSVSPRPSLTSEFYMLFFAVTCFALAPSEGFVRISVRTKSLTGSDLLKDIGDSNFIIQRHYKPGETLGQLTLAGVIDVRTTQEISFHLEHNFNTPILFGHSTDVPGIPHGSFILLQAADARLDAVTYLEHVTDFQIGWSVYSFKNPIADLGPLLQKSRAVTSYQSTVYENDFMFDPLYDSVDMGIANGVMTISSDSLSLPCFSLAKIIFGEDILHLFRHKGIGSTVTLSAGDSPAHFVILASEVSQFDEGFTQPITGVDGSGALVLGTNWKSLNSSYIPADLTKKRKGSVTTTLNQDLSDFPKVLAIALASGLRESFSIGIEEFLVNVYPPFQGLALKGTTGLNRPASDYHLRHALFALSGAALNHNSKRSYSIGATPVALPIGDLSEPPSIAVYTVQLTGPNLSPLDRYIRFSEDAPSTRVETRVTLLPTSSLISNNEDRTITFTWSRYSGGTGTPIPGSNYSFTISHAHGNAASHVRWAFEADFLANEEIGLTSVATAGVGDAAKIESSGTTKEALVQVSFTR